MKIAWNRNGAAVAAAPQRVVLDREQFVAACESERARSERSGLAFSLLTFHFSEDGDARDVYFGSFEGAAVIGHGTAH